MNRREFLGASGATIAVPPARTRTPPPLPVPDANAVAEHTHLLDLAIDGTGWSVWEDLRAPDGAISFVAPGAILRLDRRTEALFDGAAVPLMGLKLRDVALADADLLAERLLAGGGDPDPAAVRDAAPPSGSSYDPATIGPRLPWTAIVGTRQAEDTMPVFANGRTRTFRPGHRFPELQPDAIAARGYEGLLGGWLPAVHKRLPRPAGGYWDLIVFADVDYDNRFLVSTWHRTQRIEHGRIVEVAYGHDYADYPPRRTPPEPTAFYRALFRFARAWQSELAPGAVVTLPETSWSDMARHAFAKELIVRPGGTWPKYGAVDRDYVGPEYDGFQDTFTSALYANLLWGRFDQARAVFDQYFSAFVAKTGLIDMRGPETAQFGLTLALIARYVCVTGDAATAIRHRDKIAATAALLADLHEEALRLPQESPGHGLIHGWNESDACLHPDPSMWWKPYWANSAFAVRGWREIAAVWPRLGGDPGEAADWSARADRLQARLIEGMRADVRRDLNPPYIGPLPGTRETFRQALSHGRASEQGWPHRAYAELLQANVLPVDLETLVIDCLRGHGGTTMGVVANIGAPTPAARDILGFISYGYAEALLRLDRIEEYLLFLYAHRYHAHTRGSWLGGEVSGITGDLALFCMPAQLTIPKLVRWMLVYEEADAERLHLARAIPIEWLMSGDRIAIAGAPTRWGAVDFSLRRTGTATIEGEMHLPEATIDEVRVHLRLPPAVRAAALSVDGRARPNSAAPAIAFRRPRAGTTRFRVTLNS